MIHLISLLSDWSPLLPLIIGVTVFFRITRESKIIVFISAIALVAQLFHFFLPNTAFQNYAYNIYTPIEFGCYFIIFDSRLKNHSYKLSKFLFLIYAITCIYFLLEFDLSKDFINQWPIVNSMIYLIFIFLLVWSSFKNDDEILLPRNSLFWYVTGILEFSVCTCLFYLFWQKIKKSEPGSVLKILWTVQNIFNIVLYLLFTIGILKSTREKVKQQ